MGVANKSEIRGVFVHCVSLDTSPPPDWGVIADTLKPYGVQAIFAEMLSVRNTYYPSAYRPNAVGRDELALAIAACHARGIEFHLSMDVVYIPKSDQPELKAVDYNGNPYDWSCASRPAYRTLVKNLVEELATKYDIDGFMFDYIRWEDTEDICYCPDCKAKFQEWLGETVTNWAPFYPEGSRQKEFLEWRNVPITEVFELIYNALKAIKPNLEISLAAWTYFDNCPIYWRRQLGQDTGDWIRKNLLDFVAPMNYTASLTELQNFVQSNQAYMTGGVEGKIPLVAFLDGERKVTTPDLFRQEVEKLRSLGVDGFIIWRYGGPGVQLPTHDYTRNFLAAITRPPVFEVKDIIISALETQATITWTTDLPATSKVEISQLPLFESVWESWRDEFYSWNTKYKKGTIIEDVLPTTQHSMTLTGLVKGATYYFRVQSKNGSGMATSKVLTFKTVGAVSRITGKVIDAKTSNPIENAIIEAGSYKTTSGIDGTFSLEVSPSVYTLTIKKDGYLAVEMPGVDATNDVNFTEAIQLTPTPPSLVPIAMSVVPGTVGLLLIGGHYLFRRG